MMKRLLKAVRVATIIILMVAVVAAPISAQSIAEGYLAGQAAGEEHPTSAGITSFTWGFLFGIIGAGGSFAFYAMQNPQPDNLARIELMDRDAEYLLAYMTAYRDAARRKMVRQSIVGGAAGMLAGWAVATAISISAAKDGDAPAAAPVISIAW